MCGGVVYRYQGQDYKTYFPNPKAKLPVKKKSSSMELMAWGRRREQEGNLPMGGWARLESIRQGRWQKYFPIPVKIPVQSFMEKDVEGVSHWFDLTEGQWIQGLLASYELERRIYVVTVTPEMEDAVHDRWPRIISGSLGENLGEKC